jgi:hypothetical protein
MKRRKYQRSSMNWNTGTATYTSHHPARDSFRPSAVGVEYQVGMSRRP